jgi:hypothetical protein
VRAGAARVGGAGVGDRVGAVGARGEDAVGGFAGAFVVGVGGEEFAEEDRGAFAVVGLGAFLGAAEEPDRDLVRGGGDRRGDRLGVPGLAGEPVVDGVAGAG